MTHNGGGVKAVQRDADQEWRAWDKLPRRIRLYLIEQPFEFSDTDALKIWHHILSVSFDEYDAYEQFEFQIRANVRHMMQLEQEERTSGRYFTTYYSEALDA